MAKSTITNLETMDVWKSRSQFNYDVWAENTVVKLCNVNWDDQQNVVVFKDKQDRSAYFDKLDGYVIPRENLLNTINQVINGQTAKVEIPFSQMNYNYLAVYHQKTPVDNPELEQFSDTFYFITDAMQTSPSVTTLTLQPDVWTTYQFDVQIDRGHYHRGHYMVDDVTVDQLFDKDFNRLASNLNTLPEPITVNSRQLGDPKLVPLCGDSAYICIMTYCDVYSDNWVNEEGIANIPYLPKTTRLAGIVNGTITIAIKRDEMVTFMNNVPKQFWKAVRGAFYADEKWLFWASEPVQKWGVTIRNISATNAFSKLIDEVNFTKEDFGFDSKYAKTYTQQFTPIDIMKGSEYVGTIGIENFNKLSVGISSNVIYPFVKIEALLAGINSNGSTSLVWERLDIDQDTVIENGDWRKTLYDLNIPIFSISELPTDNWEYENTAEIARLHDNRDIDYAINTRNAETAKTNADASANTSFNNTADTLATNYATGNRSNQNTYDNANRSAETSKTTSDRTNDNALAMAKKQNQFDYNLNDATNTFDNGEEGMRAYQRDNQIRTLDMENNILDDDYNYNMTNGSLEVVAGMGFQGLRQFGVSPSASEVRNATKFATDRANGAGLGQMTLNAIAGVSTFAGGILVQGGTTLVSWALAQARLTHDYNMAKIRYNTGKAIFQSLANETRFRSSEFNTTWNSNKKTNADEIAQTNHDVEQTNIQNIYDTSIANNLATYNTTSTNLTADKTTGDSNNNRSLNTTLANNTRSYNTAMANAQDEYNRVDVNINRYRESMRVGDILQRGESSGDYFQYNTGRLHFQFLIRKPDSKTLANIESMFDNFGYTWDEYIGDIQNYVTGDKFNYWQIDDILFKPTKLKQNYIDKIRNMFANGVRMWKVEAIND